MIETIPWWAWAALSVAIALVELHAPGYYFIWIACGAGLTAAVGALIPLSLSAQLAVLAAASALSCAGGYFAYGRHHRRAAADSTLNERSRQLIGAHGVVAVPIVNGQGKVRIGDTVWLAEGPDLAAGTAVTVSAARGTCLVVAAAETPRA